MNARTAAEAVLLVGVVVTCWLGVLGMLRMREPMQALHYLSLPASLGAVLLTIAVFLATGNSQASWKMTFIAIVLICTNSVITHTTARAFRVRELGHWKPQPGDKIEQVMPESSSS
jgi:monovalent cation/proton antiporter MnhG/PhaG subunit